MDVQPYAEAAQPVSGALRWDAERARAVKFGLQRMAERGLLSERDRRRLAARLDSLPIADSPPAGRGATTSATADAA